MKRPSFEKLYMQLACGLASRSTCSRLQVGTVITTIDYHKILSIGYNGNIIKGKNNCDSKEPGNCGCIHSECNAVINYDVSRNIKKIIFITHSPCYMCAKILINLGNIKKIYIKNTYRDKKGLLLLQQNHISITWMK